MVEEGMPCLVSYSPCHAAITLGEIRRNGSRQFDFTHSYFAFGSAYPRNSSWAGPGAVPEASRAFCSPRSSGRRNSIPCYFDHDGRSRAVVARRSRRAESRSADRRASKPAQLVWAPPLQTGSVTFELVLRIITRCKDLVTRHPRRRGLGWF